MSYLTPIFFSGLELLECDIQPNIWYDPFASDVYALGVSFYLMAFRKYPRNDGDAKSTIAESRRMAFDFDAPRKYKKGESPHKPLSTRARHLITAMLEYDPRKRITMKGILTHKFLERCHSGR